MLLSPVITRIAEQVPELTGRVHGAAEYRRLLESRALQNAAGGAYVMPAGLRGGRVQSAAGAYVQDLDEVVAVVLFVPNPNPGNTRQVATIDALVKAVVEALCGWVPGGAIGPFQLLRGAMINLGGGSLAYQVEFTVADQLRIAP
jgi:hypothetical protein